MKSEPRRLVWQLLTDGGALPTRVFEERAAGLDAADRALAKELLHGVLRRRRTLDTIYAPYVTGRVRDEALEWALRIGVYQLFFLRVPAHAALHTTLEAVKPGRGAKTGFLNAVLRAVQRGATPAGESGEDGEDGEDGEAGDARRRLVTPQGTWDFDRPLFADPAADRDEHLADLHSYPSSLVRRWRAAAGEERAVDRMQRMNGAAPLWLRVNALRSDPVTLAAEWQAAGLAVERGPASAPHALRVHDVGGDVAALPGFGAGLWAVQDLSAQESALLGAPQPGERVLDLCAAPGGKAFALHEAAGGQARITAADVNAARMRTLEQERARLGHEEVATVTISEDDPGALAGQEWDLVVCDVPCTNTGVLDKRPEARWRFGRKELHRAVSAQNLLRKRLLEPVLGPRTRVLWITCSLEPEENEEAAARLARHAGLRVAGERRFEPSPARCGGYAALLEPAS